MKRMNWRLRLAIGLVVTSAVLYVAHYFIFHDFHHIAIYTVHDIAFLPLEVLLVTMVLHELLERRARLEMLHKLNMVIGAFFSEVGTELLGRSAAFDTATADVSDALIVDTSWSAKEYDAAKQLFAARDHQLDADAGDLVGLREFLVTKRDFLLRLLENPNLLEHESFTELLWAVFHLSEELEHRTDLAALPATDKVHLAGDIKRAYTHLVLAWLDHVRHLKDQYPYLFSLAVRTNPLDPTASINVMS